MKHLALLSFLFIALFASALPAQTIKVDLGRTAYPTTGEAEAWNDFAGADSYRFPGAGSAGDLPTLLTDMVALDGSATTWDLAATGWSTLGRGGSPNAGVTAMDYPGSTVDFPETASRDAIYTSGAMQFELQGLQANSLYELTFFAGSPEGTARRETHWNIGAQYEGGNTFTGGTDLFVNPEGNDLLRLAVVSSDANGVISWWWYTGSAPSESASAALWNTFTVTAVPEPSSMLLLIAALVFLISRASAKKASGGKLAQ